MHAGCHALDAQAKHAPVAQLDRALDYESRGQEFESLRARHFANLLKFKTGSNAIREMAGHHPRHVRLTLNGEHHW
jgi:hypothetical protein